MILHTKYQGSRPSGLILDSSKRWMPLLACRASPGGVTFTWFKKSGSGLGKVAKKKR